MEVTGFDSSKPLLSSMGLRGIFTEQKSRKSSKFMYGRKGTAEKMGCVPNFNEYENYR